MAPSNVFGTQVIFDGEVPRTYTAQAANTISGGEYVVAVGVNNAVGSSISSYQDGDLKVGSVVANAKGVEKINGIALNTITSGGFVTVAQNGTYLVQAGGSVLPGMLVEALNGELIQSVGSQTIPSGKHTGVPGAKNIGRALTSAASGTTDNYAAVNFHF